MFVLQRDSNATPTLRDSRSAARRTLARATSARRRWSLCVVIIITPPCAQRASPHLALWPTTCRSTMSGLPPSSVLPWDPRFTPITFSSTAPQSSSSSSSPPPSSSVPSSSPLPSPAGKRYLWKKENTKLLVELAQQKKVWSVTHNNVTNTWEDIAHCINRKHPSAVASGRACREKYQQLCRTATQQHRTHAQRSGDAESYDAVDQALLECIEATQEHELQSERTKEDVKRRAAAITQRQSELKEDTMQTLSGRKRPSSVSPTSMSSSSSSAVDGPEEDDAKYEKEEEADRGSGRKKRLNIRTLIAESIEANSVRFAAQEKQTAAIMASQEKSSDRLTDVVEKIMGSTNAILSQLIANNKPARRR